MANQYRNFQARQSRAASIDGFLSGASQQARRSGYKNTPSAVNEGGGSQAQPVLRGNQNAGRPVLPQQERVQQNDTLPSLAQSDSNQHEDQEKSAIATNNPSETLNPYFYTAATDKAGYREPAQSQPGTDRDRTKKSKKVKKPKKPTSLKKRILKILGVLLLIALLAFGGRLVFDLAKMTNSNPLSVLGAFRRVPLKNENGRTNILVAGNSADDDGHAGGDLTDSIMLLSVDTDKKTALMLSIPRDLWVKIPGNGHTKINSVYSYGGMDKLVSTVSTELEIPIHYNALVNYAAFKDMVDAVDGIKITIDSDDPRGIYDSNLDWTSRNCCSLAKYPNGPVELDGKKALNLARARGNGYGSYGFNADFTRSEHQRKMLVAVKDKAMSSETLSNPLKISNLVSAVGKNVSTDLELAEIQTLYSYIKDIPNNKIDSYNINTLKGEKTTMLENYATPDGQSALIPAAGLDDFSEIAAQLERVFNATPVSKEAADVVVLNGTNWAGLARGKSRELKKLGVNVVSEGNATDQPRSTIIDSSEGKKPNTLNELKRRYNATVVTDATLKATYPNADFVLVLGDDAKPKEPANQATN